MPALGNVVAPGGVIREEHVIFACNRGGEAHFFGAAVFDPPEDVAADEGVHGKYTGIRAYPKDEPGGYEHAGDHIGVIGLQSADHGEGAGGGVHVRGDGCDAGGQRLFGEGIEADFNGAGGAAPVGAEGGIAGFGDEEFGLQVLQGSDGNDGGAGLGCRQGTDFYVFRENDPVHRCEDAGPPVTQPGGLGLGFGGLPGGPGVLPVLTGGVSALVEAVQAPPGGQGVLESGVGLFEAEFVGPGIDLGDNLIPAHRVSHIHADGGDRAGHLGQQGYLVGGSDGAVNGDALFKIDNPGLNHPHGGDELFIAPFGGLFGSSGEGRVFEEAQGPEQDENDEQKHELQAEKSA